MDTRSLYRAVVTGCLAVCLGTALSAHRPVTQSDPATFHIFGLVANPGAYAWAEAVTVKDAVSLAGGYTADGSPQALEIQRMVDGKLVSTVVSEDDVVLEGDVVMVRGAAFRPRGRDA